jgi:GT2 family glycosyltransferase
VNTIEYASLKIVIVNWCNAPDTIECLQSILNANVPLSCIILVDNGSVDNSVSIISSAFPGLEFRLIKENLGYAGGYNSGIQAALLAGASRIFILNNDTIIDQDTIPALTSSDWDISVPKIYYYTQRKLTWSAGGRWRRFPPMVIMRGYKKVDSPRYQKIVELEYATGCALMVKDKVFRTVGFFDEEYQNYFEDYDFFYRVRNAGFHVGYEPMANVWHKVAQSLGIESPKRLRYLGRNSVLFYLKNKRFTRGVYASYFIWVTFRELVKFNFRHIREFWSGAREGLDWIRHGTSSL